MLDEFKVYFFLKPCLLELKTLKDDSSGEKKTKDLTFKIVQGGENRWAPLLLAILRSWVWGQHR